jgi:Ca2+-binding RTX toxin-like protein
VTRSRLPVCVAAAALVVAALPGSALGGTVTMVGGSLSFQDSAGEVNVVTVTSDAMNIVFTETGPQGMGGPGMPCDQPAFNVVSCPSAGMTALDLHGGNLDDRLTNQTALPAQIFGEAGHDALGGGPGADVLEGAPGDDTLSGGPGADRLLGGPGLDTVAYSTEPDVNVRLGSRTGSTRLPGDRDSIDEVENVRGGSLQDTVAGSSGANVLAGAAGEDYLDGLGGRDVLDGGGSADVVVSRDGAPNEPVSCGPGRDFAIVDRGDRVLRRGKNRCERVDDGSTTRPRPGWVYVHPLTCTEEVRLGLPAQHRLVPLRHSILLSSGFRRRPPPTLDAADCTFRLRAALEGARVASADVSGGPATVDQTSGRTITTELTVKRPACSAQARFSVAPTRDPRVRINTLRRRGHWKVRGKYSIGGSFGTDWTTIDGCSETTTIVRRGRVKVFDRAKRRTVVVRAGHRYVARRGRSPG